MYFLTAHTAANCKVKLIDVGVVMTALVLPLLPLDTCPPRVADSLTSWHRSDDVAGGPQPHDVHRLAVNYVTEGDERNGLVYGRHSAL